MTYLSRAAPGASGRTHRNVEVNRLSAGGKGGCSMNKVTNDAGKSINGNAGELH